MINCCKGCVAPKRHTACHDTCEEYKAEKNAHEKRKLEYYGDPRVQSGLIAQRHASVSKAIKSRKV